MTDEVLDPHLTTKIVSSYVRHHTVGADQVSDLITSVHRALVDASIDETGIVAFLARRGEEARLLYSRPDRIGMGAGTQLIEATKAAGTTSAAALRPSPRSFASIERCSEYPGAVRG